MNLNVIGSAGADTVEERALRELYLAHGPALHAYVLRLLNGDMHRAEDVVQETLLRCWQKFDLSGQEGKAVRPWVFRVARNLVIDGHRTRLARPQEVGSDTSWLNDMCTEINDIDRVLVTMVIRDALEALTPVHREALLETFFADRTVQQAAAVLGVAPGTVKSRVFYGLRSLRLALQERGVDAAAG
ncbi:sigma-70 family RNA polymerase sigma factor [Streptomyces hyaluromycini]|uniref:sigma-70 family RNA polymerase sigma factor n=1 Tax=Streptomyces hyaluromycini TaxID=1377993 RepID=UPI000B5C39A8|nr:sigma-70 family RNA polymerase sigma factor [Streptomyces hyaluromycini]